ncbi:MAG: hypothetical protein L6V85_10550 [Clostridiales bacterium]|nr:MAG: hypothetical protein L6V85_10550 [Clostridiales bacterium]
MNATGIRDTALKAKISFAARYRPSYRRRLWGLMQVAGIDLDYEVREEDGYLKFTLPRFQRKDAATPI